MRQKNNKFLLYFKNDRFHVNNFFKGFASFLSRPVSIFIISILINVILFTLFFYFVTPHFQTNDDPVIMEFASGARIGQPSEYLMYINVIIGKFLQILYLNFPGINWYPVFFYLIHFISMTTILYCFLLRKKNIYGFLIYLLLFSFLELYHLANLQFTTTAFIAGLAGFILLLTFLDERGKKFYLPIAGSIILITISGLIRRNVFYLLLGLSAVVFGFKFLERKSWRIPIILIIIVLLFGLLGFLNDNYYNKDKDWSFYLEYNKYMAKMISYPYFGYSENRDIYSRAGWSENDVTLFKLWFFCHPEVYSLNNIKYVSSNVKISRGAEETFTTLKESFSRMDLRLKWFTGSFLIIAILLLKKDKNKYLFSVIFTSLIISIYLSYLGRLTNWVFSPIIFFTAATAAFFLCNDEISDRFKILRNIILKSTILVVCMALVTVGFIFTANDSKINLTKQRELEQVIQKLSDEDKIYVIQGGANLEDKVIFFSMPQKKEYLDMVQLGWMINTPFYYKTLEKYSIDDIYEAIVDRDDVYVICAQSVTEILKKFIYEHYDRHVSSALIYELVNFPVNVYEFN